MDEWKNESFWEMKQYSSANNHTPARFGNPNKTTNPNNKNLNNKQQTQSRRAQTLLAFAWFVVGFWAKEMVVVCCDATNRQKRKVKTRIPFLKPPSSFGKYAARKQTTNQQTTLLARLACLDESCGATPGLGADGALVLLYLRCRCPACKCHAVYWRSSCRQNPPTNKCR